MASALQVKDLVKVYRNRHQPVRAVAGISFSISPGECFGLLGPNGAGKTTAMRCIAGFYPPTSGQVWIQAVDVHADPKTARGCLGVCAQEDTLDTDFTTLEQMIQFARFFGIGRKEAMRRACALLDRFDLSAKRGEMIESLSGGMRRRLQVARSLINEPSVLILDEPTTGLDPEVRRVLWDVLSEERKNGLAILLSTHYMEEAERLCDRVAVIHRGVFLAVDDPQRLVRQQMGTAEVEEEIRPGVRIRRAPHLEDVYLKLTGSHLQRQGGSEE